MTLYYFAAFYFNAKGAFIGEFAPQSEYAKKGYNFFLATRLLPVGGVHKGVLKFTGNDSPGHPTNPLDQLIHAFAHFAYLYADQKIVFCDLQGSSSRPAT